MAPTVLVSGAGIAGLSLAHFLSRTGKFRVRLFERSPDLCTSLGAHFGLNGALACLDRAGLRHVWEGYYHETKGCRYYRPGGRVYARVDYEEALRGTEFEGRYGIFMRAELQASLAKELPEGILECGKEVVGVQDQGDRVCVQFQDGSMAEGSILVAADGINSAVRHMVFPDVKKVYSGIRTWYVVHDDPAPPEVRHHMTQMCSKDRLAMAFACGSRGQLVVVAATRGPEPTTEELERDRTVEQFREVLTASGVFDAGWLKEEQLLTASRLFHFGVHSMPPCLPSWSVGRVCLVGDAIHATTPFLGQGGNQAVQSAFCLARLLAERGVDDYAGVFREYHGIREPPTSKINKMSTAIAQMTLPPKDASCLAGIPRHLFNMLIRVAPRVFARRMASSMEVKV